MTLTVHHLRRSQSERIVWLCEELHLPYTLKPYNRDPFLSPPELRALHPSGTAPIIEDGDVKLGESGAIVQYILAKYDGNGHLQVPPSNRNYPDYLYWLHYANSTLQPAILLNMFMTRAQCPSDDPSAKSTRARQDRVIKQLDNRLRDHDWLAGEHFTAADVMTVFSLTTMRLFMPIGFEEYPNVVRFLERVGKREGYRRAMEKGDPGFEPALGKESPKSFFE